MKKSKYYIIADSVGYYSNSRNARQHLKNTGARHVLVCKNDEDETNVCRAIRLADCIMVGTCRR